jgi:hypothetical protein
MASSLLEQQPSDPEKQPHRLNLALEDYIRAAGENHPPCHRGVRGMAQ